jgi:hypothetical protein
VQSEEACGDERKQPVSEKAFGHEEEEQHDGDVQEHVQEMESVGKATEGAIADEISDGHQGPIVVADALGAFKAPDSAAEDPTQISKAMDIRIFENLRPVVINEAICEGVEIRQGSEQDEYQERKWILALPGLRAYRDPRHEIMVPEGSGGIYDGAPGSDIGSNIG